MSIFARGGLCAPPDLLPQRSPGKGHCSLVGSAWHPGGWPVPPAWPGAPWRLRLKHTAWLPRSPSCAAGTSEELIFSCVTWGAAPLLVSCVFFWTRNVTTLLVVLWRVYCSILSAPSRLISEFNTCLHSLFVIKSSCARVLFQMRLPNVCLLAQETIS